MQCKNCTKNFIIADEDRKFYAKLGVPNPTYCSDCRTQRRMAYRNERNLYPRQCEACQKNILSMYSSDKPFPVYCRDCWRSDKWDA